MSDVIAATRTIGTYGSYAEAEATMRWLRQCQFPDGQAEVRVRGLRFVEPEWRRAALRLVMLALAGLVLVAVGIAFGTLPWQRAVFSVGFSVPAVAVLGWWLTSRRHELTMGAGYVAADGFDVVVNWRLADEAIRLLQN